MKHYYKDHCNDASLTVENRKRWVLKWQWKVCSKGRKSIDFWIPSFVVWHGWLIGMRLTPF